MAEKTPSWTYKQYVRLVLEGDTIENFARFIASNGLTPETRATLIATIASSEGDAGDRVKCWRALAYDAWQKAGYQKRLVADILLAAGFDPSVT